MRVLQCSGLLERAYRDDAFHAPVEGIYGQGEGAEHIDDDGDAASRASSFDEIGRRNLHAAAHGYRPAAP